MKKLGFLVVVGVTTASVVLALPSASQAQTWEYRNGEWSYNSAPGYNGSYSPGYPPGYNGSYNPGYAPSYNGSYSPGYAPSYNGSYNPGYAPSYNGYQGSVYAPRYGAYYQPRPGVVHPEVLHWTPGRGWHTHGHIHVPHGNHYHTYRY